MSVRLAGVKDPSSLQTKAQCQGVIALPGSRFGSTPMGILSGEFDGCMDSLIASGQALLINSAKY